MAWQKPQQTDDKVNPESFVTKVMNNVIDYDFDIATSTDSQKIAGYTDRFVWLVNFAEGVCKGARLIQVNNSFIDFDNLSEKESLFMEAARELFKERYSKNVSTAAASIEVKARGLLEEVVSGAYDAKRNQKQLELDQLVLEGKLQKEKLPLELARYRFQLLIEAAEAKKTIRKEMNQ